ncbi:hypothetical protein [Nostoc sp. UHCC 0252]|nr:hypothetical protein [Nostoc sp. UHCC 0252]MEA5603132.1 hypothetical protein [Nostoc sp. UHCC 0252]
MSKNFLLLTHYFYPAQAQALRGVVRNPGITNPGASHFLKWLKPTIIH